MSRSTGPERADTVPGAFIAFEGLDGSGKSTVLSAVARALREQGRTVLTTREPGGTALGSAIRNLVLGQEHRPTARTELLLMCADRAEHVATVIQPALERGEIVISDRFEASTRAYQGGGLGLDDRSVTESIQAATGGLRPDLYLLFDVDPLTAFERRQADAESINALDQRALDFRQRVRDRYLDLAASEPDWTVIDANQRLECVTQAALATVYALVGEPMVNP